MNNFEASNSEVLFQNVKSIYFKSMEKSKKSDNNYVLEYLSDLWTIQYFLLEVLMKKADEYLEMTQNFAFGSLARTIKEAVYKEDLSILLAFSMIKTHNFIADYCNLKSQKINNTKMELNGIEVADAMVKNTLKGVSDTIELLKKEKFEKRAPNQDTAELESLLNFFNAYKNQLLYFQQITIKKVMINNLSVHEKMLLSNEMQKMILSMNSDDNPYYSSILIHIKRA